MKDKTVQGLDPAFRTGCKLAVIDRTGKYLDISVIYPHEPKNETLKAKLQSGVAHFEYVKKNGEIREAWGTTCSNLMKAKVYGGGIRRDFVNCVVYWDVEVGDFRSLRFENLIKVF